MAKKMTQNIRGIQFGCWMFSEDACPRSSARRKYLAILAKRAYEGAPQHEDGSLDYDADVEFASNMETLVISAGLWQSRPARNQLKRSLRWSNNRCKKKASPDAFIEE